jgi:citrate lyase subunit beta/citryl-CoA lyase
MSAELPDGGRWSPGPAWLFCPADRPDRYEKAALSADVVILDLEDAVAPTRKALAREALRAAVRAGQLNWAETVIRINAAGTPDHIGDLALIHEVAAPRVMLAKAEMASDVAAIDADVIALVESARGLEAVSELADAENTIGLMWGADDLIGSLGGTISRDPAGAYWDVVRSARSRILVAAKARDLLALDAVYMSIPDLDGLEHESREAVAVGFDAKVAIHPCQLEPIRGAYRPSNAEVEAARRLLSVDVDQRGVTTVDGAMVDGPLYRQAEAILRRAVAGGPTL